MAPISIMFGLLLLAIPALSKPAGFNSVEDDPDSKSTYDVLLPNGEVKSDLNLDELRLTLDEFYADLTSDAELLDRIDIAFDEIVDDMMDSEEMKTLSQAEKEQRLIDVVLKMKDESVSIYKEFFREKTGKDVIT